MEIPTTTFPPPKKKPILSFFAMEKLLVTTKGLIERENPHSTIALKQSMRPSMSSERKVCRDFWGFDL